MKKSLVLSLLFILIASAIGFSADGDQVTFVVTGDASVTWGIDLDFLTTGFVNVASSELKITLVVEQDMEKGTEADGAVYGYIFLENFKWEVGTTAVDNGKHDDGLDNDGDTVIDEADEFGTVAVAAAPVMPTITAKIYAKPVFVKIYSKPEIKPNKASIYTSLGSKLGVIDTVDLTPLGLGTISLYDFVGFDLSGTGGIEVGVDTDMVDVAVQLMSFGSYVDGSFNAFNVYSLGLTSTITPFTGFNIELAAGLKFDQFEDNTAGTFENPIEFGVGVSYEIDLGGDMKLIPKAGFDGYMDSETVLGLATSLFLMEIGGGVRLKWAGTYDADKDNHMLVYDGSNKKVFSGLTVGVNMLDASYTVDGTDAFTFDPQLNLVVSAYEDSKDDGLLPIVGMALLAEVENLTAANAGEMDLGIAAFIDATINGIRPYASVEALHLQNAATDLVDPLSVLAIVGVDLPVFAQTTLTVEWKSDDLVATKDDTAEGIAGKGALGNLTVKLKIAY